MVMSREMQSSEGLLGEFLPAPSELAYQAELVSFLGRALVATTCACMHAWPGT